MLMSSKIYFTAEEVSKILNVSKSVAYTLIRKWNEELETEGYLTLSGKIPVKYFKEHVYFDIDEIHDRKE